MADPAPTSPTPAALPARRVPDPKELRPPGLLGRIGAALDDLRFAIGRGVGRRWLRPKTLGYDAVAATAGQPMCYVLPHHSRGDLLVLDQVCASLGLPAPRAPVTGVQPHLRHAHLFLAEPAGMFRRQTMRATPQQLRALQAAVAAHPELDVQLVPVSIFWSRAPDREGSLWKLLLAERWAVAGRIRKLAAALFNRHEVLVQFGTPMPMRPVVDLGLGEDRTARRMARLLRAHFRQQRTAVIGPDLSHRRTLVTALLKTPPVRAAIAAEAARSGRRPERVARAARRNAMEIASDISFRVVRFFDILLTWTWQRLYDGVRLEGLDAVKPWAENHELVYVPCHRSHMDYLLLSYVLYHNGLSLPHIAAGRNLNLPVVGSLLRRAGAFFMRRSFKDDPLYSTVFNEYLYMVLRRGHAMEYFVEGGRSRTGRLLPPRGGMLSMTLRAVLRDLGRPLAFVPVYFGYEKLVEIRSYMGELQGQAKQPESLTGLVRSARRTLRQSFGQVQVVFGEPIAVEPFLDANVPDWRDDLVPAAVGAIDAPPPPPWLRDAVAELGRNILERVNAAAAVNPVNLLALALLCAPRAALDAEELEAQVDLYLHLLRQGPGSSGLVLPDGDAAAVLAHVEDMGLLLRQAHPLGDILGLAGQDQVLLTWFRNNSLHTLAIPALVAALCLGHGQITRGRLRAQCQAIQPYLANELFMPADAAEATRIHAWLKVLEDVGLVQQQGAGEDCVITAAPPGTVARSRLVLLARVLRQTLERYFLVLAVLEAQGSGQVSTADLQDHCQQMAERLARLHDLNAPEFFDRRLFVGFLAELQRQGLIEAPADGPVTFDTRLDRILDAAGLVIDSDFRQAVERSRPSQIGAAAAQPEGRERA